MESFSAACHSTEPEVLDIWTLGVSSLLDPPWEHNGGGGGGNTLIALKASSIENTDLKVKREVGVVLLGS